MMNEKLFNRVVFWLIILASVTLVVIMLVGSMTYQYVDRRAEATKIAMPTMTAETLEMLYEKGIGYMNIDQWQEAKATLQLVFEIDPDYRDVQDRLKVINTKIVSLDPQVTPTILSSSTISEKAVRGDGLIAYYSFDGNADDSSGNGHHGSIVGNPTILPGVRGQAFEFDGDDYIQVNNSSDFEPGIGNYSVVAWVRYRPDATGQRILTIFDRLYSFRWIQMSGTPEDDIKFGLKSGTNPSQTMARYSPIKDNEWHLIVGVRENVNTVKLYVDGMLVDEITNPNLGNVQTTSNGLIYIGHDPGYEGPYNDGDIDELRIYNRALSDVEIQTLYNTEQ